MGCYINLGLAAKELFLVARGQRVSADDAFITTDSLPVCLINNGPFTSAAVAYNDSELAAFKRADGREKTWFMVSKDDLYDVCDLADYNYYE